MAADFRDTRDTQNGRAIAFSTQPPARGSKNGGVKFKRGKRQSILPPYFTRKMR